MFWEIAVKVYLSIAVTYFILMCLIKSMSKEAERIAKKNRLPTWIVELVIVSYGVIWPITLLAIGYQTLKDRKKT